MTFRNDPSEGIDRFDADSLTYSEFKKNYLERNMPCIIEEVTKHWVINEKYASLSVKEFEEAMVRDFGNAKVPVLFQGSRKEETLEHVNEYGGEECRSMKLAEFFSIWREKGTSLNRLSQANVNQWIAEGVPYLKDWHFVKEFPDLELYEVPEFFQDDWLNAYCVSKKKSDYKFMYCGAQGSYTPLHHDVLKSFSWSVNIFGSKLWVLFDPAQTSHLVDSKQRNHVSNVFSNDESMAEDFPDLHKTTPKIVIQKRGEAIFVPSGWYHQVINLEDTLSINHNWFNAYCLPSVSDYLSEQLTLTRSALIDIRKNEDTNIFDFQFEQKCEQILKLNVGMNFQQWIELVHFVLSQEKDMCKLELEKVETSISKVLSDGHLCQFLRCESETLDEILAILSNLFN
eukprot:CAMPEP_0184011800 /NCGR_PEP_ID=MMETSP0954-20121128/4029_1 /TAXON_ID=627963 /ORGANISM="Aplanochytrium sp, Strain PBS07" /LENGTH=398 /DNA_ID=CAMNT_0026291659 /DNA_START=336 /DNA_END=1532 /DNA_ORIENTATION=+